MATDYMELPIVQINNYLWSLASGSVSGIAAVSSAVWNTASYTYRPFYPITENLAPDSRVMPYVLYDYMPVNRPGTTLYAINKEEATYTIVGDVPQIFYVKNFIYDALNRFDESARNVNENSSSSINFKFIQCYQDSFVLDEKRIDSYKPKYITTLTIEYEYTR